MFAGAKKKSAKRTGAKRGTEETKETKETEETEETVETAELIRAAAERGHLEIETQESELRNLEENLLKTGEKVDHLDKLNDQELLDEIKHLLKLEESIRSIKSPIATRSVERIHSIQRMRLEFISIILAEIQKSENNQVHSELSRIVGAIDVQLKNYVRST